MSVSRPDSRCRDWEGDMTRLLPKDAPCMAPLRRPHPGGPENHAVSAARSGNAAAGTVGMRRCCPIVVTPLVQWRSDIGAILLVT